MWAEVDGEHGWADRGPVSQMAIETTILGTGPNGAEIHRYVLHSATGMSAVIISYGARLAALTVPSPHGESVPLVLGFDDLRSYLTDCDYFGAVCGRYANRIAGGRFSLDGVDYTLPLNDPMGPNTLHGGTPGFSDVVWGAETAASADYERVVLRYFSPHLQNGFPGNVEATVTYTLRDHDLEVGYHAVSDRPTPLSLTNHSYWNLDTPSHGDVLEHTLQIEADFYTPFDDYLIPTGEIRSVRDTPLDFSVTRRIGWQRNRLPDGYDHNYVLRGSGMRRAVVLQNDSSSRTLEVLSDAPAMQLYTGGGLTDAIRGRGLSYGKFAGVVFEPQHFPDSVHHPDFTSAIVRPGQPWQSRTIFRCRWV